jgi:hypothetical protein
MLRAVDSACIGLEHDGLTLFDVHGADDEIWWCAARLAVPGLTAELPRVTANYAVVFQDLIDFLSGMARDWRGWNGERVYESLEGELRLIGSYNRHVKIVATLRQSTVEDGWSATGTFTVDPGEQMSKVASDVSELLGTRRRRGFRKRPDRG